MSSSSSRRRGRSTDSSRMDRLSVADVYDVAADIGKEFERVIDSHGPDHVSALMQKVISALEHLEQFAAAGDAEDDTVEQLRTTITHYELDEAKRTEERQRINRELEQVEEHYKQETRDLLSTVKRLQDENRKLSSSLAAATERDSAFSEDESSYFEVDLVNRLQTVIEKQRGQLKKLDQTTLDLRTENDELRCHNEKLSTCNRDLRRKFRATQLQLHQLIDERAELTAKLHDSHREVQQLARRLGSAEKECEDLSLECKKKNDDDVDDRDRPRFTLPELKEILQERNGLKARVSDLEDELAVFRPRTHAGSGVNSPRHGYKVRMRGPANCDCSYHAKSNNRQLSSIESDGDGDTEVSTAKEALETDGRQDDEECDDEDLPVQGPLPQDPEDAPWRRKEESGIRKLFRRVFGSTATGSIPTSISTPAGLNQSAVNSSPERRMKITKSFSRFSFLLTAADNPVEESSGEPPEE